MTLRSLIAIATVALCSQLASLPLTSPLPAEAGHTPLEGFGAVTQGGAGKPNCIVTSLADSGPGTLRDCVANGNRHVTFAVSGEIRLRDWLYIGGPFVTIDGFSAPSPGITIRDQPVGIFRNVGSRPNSHDVIIRGLRFRHASGSRDCISIYGQTFNIVIDHVSVATCGDGGIDVVSGPRNVTIQWSIIADDKAMLLGATAGSTYTGTERISVHHNVFTHGVDRMPMVRLNGYSASDTTVDIRQNIFRGWLRANGTKIEDGAWANLVGNTYIPRPDSTESQRANSVQIASGARVYTAGNVELGSAPQPDYNRLGRERSPLPAPAITAKSAGCVATSAGVRPLDAVDRELLRGLTTSCADAPSSPEPAPTPPPGSNDGSTARPDLVPRTLSAPSGGTAGQTVSVTATIANGGTASAGASTARVYLSTDAALSSNDVAVGAISVPALAAGAAHTATASLTLPAGTASGSYRLLLQADDARGITESNEMNNTLAIPFTISTTSGGSSEPTTPSGPVDLAVIAAGRPDSATRGTAFTVEFTVQNYGTSPSPASDVRVYLSADRTLSSNDVDLGVRSPVPALAGGAKHSTYRVPVTIPTSVARGTYALLFVVDAPNAIPETNEGNNTRPRASFSVR